ncbi:MAG: hypothetical protein V4454_11075 [Pseudomonadota bacterium]
MREDFSPSKITKCFSTLLLLVLAGCAGQVKYTPPATPTNFVNSKEVNKPRDDVWTTLIPALGRQFFVINNMDKSSGLINVSYSGDPEKYVDCGFITSDVQNATGKRTYAFPGSSANQNYQMFTPQMILVSINRRMDLDGRVNLILEAVGPTKTVATVNTRYVVKRDQEMRASDGRGGRQSHTISFNGGSSAAFPSNGDQAAECRSTGALEREILELVR